MAANDLFARLRLLMGWPDREPEIVGQADGSTTYARYARITEALMQYECMGMRCCGMSENLDLMENGVPLSIRAYKEAA